MAETGDLRVALDAVAAAVAEATRADLAVPAHPGRRRAPRRASGRSRRLVARRRGGRHPGARRGGRRRRADRDRPAGRRSSPGQPACSALPARAGGHVVGSVELIRAGEEFADDDRAVAGLAAGQLALAVRTLAPEIAGSRLGAHRLELAGEALAAGGDVRRVRRSKPSGSRSRRRVRGEELFGASGEGRPELVASLGSVESRLGRAAAIVARSRRAAASGGGLRMTQGRPTSRRLTLGQPPFAALQLFFAEEVARAGGRSGARSPRSQRAPRTLCVQPSASASSSASSTARRSLLEVVAEAISRLSLAHTLETAVERIAELLQVEQVGRVPARRRPAAAPRPAAASRPATRRSPPRSSRHCAGRCARGGRCTRTSTDRSLRSSASVPRSRSAGPPSRRSQCRWPRPRRADRAARRVSRAVGDSARARPRSLAALAAQLAVAVQNARLHEQSHALGEALTAVLETERQVSRRVNALYEISRSFAQTLSLDRRSPPSPRRWSTSSNVDAAVIRVPDERGDQFVPRAVARRGVAARRRRSRDSRTSPAAAAAHAASRRCSMPSSHSGSAAPMRCCIPFLLGGADGRAAADRDSERTARAAHDRLARSRSADHARDPRDRPHDRRSRPRSRSTTPGSTSSRRSSRRRCSNRCCRASGRRSRGSKWERCTSRRRRSTSAATSSTSSNSRDGRLAVVLGDVTGHGIDATADMAMAKFVFRSLAREHSEPSAFLAACERGRRGRDRARQVHHHGLRHDRFGRRGARARAPATPSPGLLRPTGAVTGLACGGLALGIDAPQAYDAGARQSSRRAASSCSTPTA